MLLEKLVEYSARIDLTPPMYVTTPIRWLIDLDPNGSFLGFVKLDGGRGKSDRGVPFAAPHIGRSVNVRTKLLADTAEYVLGLPKNPKKPARSRKCNEEFVKAVRDCADRTSAPAVRAVAKFLDRLDVKRLDLPGDLSPSDNVSFRVAGKLPFDLPAVQRYWAETAGEGSGSQGKSSEEVMECVVGDHKAVPVRRLAFKIKGIPGGQTAGMALISANSRAFESYGLEESLIAPICEEHAERFSKAMNDLLHDERTSLRVGALAYVFWTKEESGFKVASLLSNPSTEDVQALIASAWTGARGSLDLDSAPFYATALSASGARVAVRDWLESTVEEVRRHIARFFLLQQLDDGYGSSGKYYGIYGLAVATKAKQGHELAPEVPKGLLRLALKGGAVPMWMLYQAVRRNSAEQQVTRNRAALIKLVLLSQRASSLKEDSMVALDSSFHEPAYLCGRLLAVLERAQQLAIPGANQTITDRFFGTASSAPGSVFPRLVRGGKAHLGKLRRDRRGAYEALERRVEEIMAGLPTSHGFPKVLTLEQQGLFALGYYHERAASRAEAIARKEAREREERITESGDEE